MSDYAARAPAMHRAGVTWMRWRAHAIGIPTSGFRQIGGVQLVYEAGTRRPMGVALLWALAREIDERRFTPIGRVCRACGGRGVVIIDLDHGAFIDPAFMARCRRAGRMIIESGSVLADAMFDSGEQSRQRPHTRIVVERCDCDGPTRPDTVELHRIVAGLAELPRPRLEWPDLWLVELDVMLSGTSDRPDWMIRWWLAFREWSHAGKVPDEDALADDLEPLIPSADFTSFESSTITPEIIQNWIARIRADEDHRRWLDVRRVIDGSLAARMFVDGAEVDGDITLTMHRDGTADAVVRSNLERYPAWVNRGAIGHLQSIGAIEIIVEIIVAHQSADYIADNVEYWDDHQSPLSWSVHMRLHPCRPARAGGKTRRMLNDVAVASQREPVRLLLDSEEQRPEFTRELERRGAIMQRVHMISPSDARPRGHRSNLDFTR